MSRLNSTDIRPLRCHDSSQKTVSLEIRAHINFIIPEIFLLLLVVACCLPSFSSRLNLNLLATIAEETVLISFAHCGILSEDS